MHVILFIIIIVVAYLVFNYLIPSGKSKEKKSELKKDIKEPKKIVKKERVKIRKPYVVIKRKRVRQGYASERSSPVGGLIGIFIFAIVATIMLPIIASVIEDVGNSSIGNLSSSDETILGLWPVLIVIGGLIAILAAAGLL